MKFVKKMKRECQLLKVCLRKARRDDKNDFIFEFPATPRYYNVTSFSQEELFAFLFYLTYRIKRQIG